MTIRPEKENRKECEFHARWRAEGDDRVTAELRAEQEHGPVAGTLTATWTQAFLGRLELSEVEMEISIAATEPPISFHSATINAWADRWELVCPSEERNHPWVAVFLFRKGVPTPRKLRLW